jgi:hypothetical protein
MALGQVFPEYFGLPLLTSFHRCPITWKSTIIVIIIIIIIIMLHKKALRLRWVRSVCCGVFLHKKLKPWYGILWCGFSFKCFNLLPSASRKLILRAV